MYEDNKVATDITIKEITSLEDFKSLEPAWRELVDKLPYSYFQFSFEWLYTWTRNVSPDGGFIILTFWKSKELVAIIPLSIITHKVKRIIPYRTLTFLSNNYSDHSDLLISTHEEKVLNLFLEYLIKHKASWDRIILRNIPEYSPTLSLLPKILEQTEFEYKTSDYKRFYYINTNNCSFNEYYSKETCKNFIRRDLKRLQKMFVREGGYAIEYFNSETNECDFERIFNVIKSIHCDRQNFVERMSMYDIPEVQNFIRDIYHIFLHQKKLIITLLKFKQQYISYAVGFIIENTYYGWNTAFNMSFSKFSPSKVLLYNLIQSCFESNISKFSFMRGESEYKERWTSDYYKAYDIIVKNKFTFKSRFVHKFK